MGFKNGNSIKSYLLTFKDNLRIRTGGETDWSDLGCEVHGVDEVDEGDIILQQAGVVGGVGEEHHRVHAQSALLLLRLHYSCQQTFAASKFQVNCLCLDSCLA